MTLPMRCTPTSARVRSCRKCTSRPSLLSAQDWDVLAEAAKWSRENAQTLKDTHWIGGDPARLEVYGWAAWSPEKGIITLRNPSDRAQDFTASLAALLELPPGADSTFTVHSPWKSDGGKPSIMIDAGDPHTFHLEPFQVLTLELTRAGAKAHLDSRLTRPLRLRSGQALKGRSSTCSLTCSLGRPPAS